MFNLNIYRCKLTALGSDYSHCRHESRPSLIMILLQLIAASRLMWTISSWTWLDQVWSTVGFWTRRIMKYVLCLVQT